MTNQKPADYLDNETLRDAAVMLKQAARRLDRLSRITQCMPQFEQHTLDTAAAEIRTALGMLGRQ